jgi:hypothetical protein
LGDGRAWESTHDEIRLLSGMTYAPSRADASVEQWIQDLVFQPRHESGRGIGFPLDVTNSTGSWHGEPDGEVEPAASAEGGENPDGR